ncbi:hypothetical protein NDU88_003741 [Pleurodeles waltl]|uniref:Uncharacterized protein n=1 Tax=Pleurodeles waltl TaxID=8319 RepID=A0AAV7PC18_PLEWA|nr:hypothetical protein NDU88_003741 [Pleurodeles waltl]
MGWDRTSGRVRENQSMRRETREEDQMYGKDRCEGMGRTQKTGEGKRSIGECKMRTMERTKANEEGEGKKVQEEQYKSRDHGRETRKRKVTRREMEEGEREKVISGSE